ncbi:hypothetical protein EK21DRAFT_95271 [Setomelanomma holmii]|uniref:Uncharacterized protein n=1 Tax=Setomelanomma holmii TaxID=210430 RepID=A0A9P4LE89_9PLEO|nr:hypothetical protein EK21DRAFT_95271 [Setomelanomma holmii]
MPARNRCLLQGIFTKCEAASYPSHVVVGRTGGRWRAAIASGHAALFCPLADQERTTPSEASVKSHHSGRPSTSKQIQTREDKDQPVLFHNFGDIEEHREHEEHEVIFDVAAMRDASGALQTALEYICSFTVLDVGLEASRKILDERLHPAPHIQRNALNSAFERWSEQ